MWRGVHTPHAHTPTPHITSHITAPFEPPQFDMNATASASVRAHAHLRVTTHTVRTRTCCLWLYGLGKVILSPARCRGVLNTCTHAQHTHITTVHTRTNHTHKHTPHSREIGHRHVRREVSRRDQIEVCARALMMHIVHSTHSHLYCQS
jgi:hypothetical protein